ncbi:MAG: type II secretion system inner membrane protein GspF [Nitrospinota bacterium]
MPVYEYKALNSKGKTVAGIIDADSSKTARLKLRKSGIFTTELKEDTRTSTKEPTKDISISTLLKKVKQQDISIMTRQLSTLVGAGLPLLEALNALVDQTSNPFLKKVIATVRERVNEGSTLADALSEHPRVFSRLFSNMVRAGESSGALEIVLLRSADYTESQLALRNKIWATLAYPILMLLIGSGVLFFLLTFVIPIVTGIFSDLEQTLPLPTLILISISDFLSKVWWIIILAIVGFIFWIKRYVRTSRGRVVIDRIKLKLPFFGSLINKIAISRFSRTLQILLSTGVNILDSLEIVRTIVNNEVLAEAIDTAKENIREGEDIAPPLERSGLFPPIVIHMIAIGEKSGRLEEMLSRVSDAYDNEVQTTIQGITSLLEPLMILVMGLVVGFIVISILLPIFEMNQIIK